MVKFMFAYRDVWNHIELSRATLLVKKVRLSHKKTCLTSSRGIFMLSIASLQLFELACLSAKFFAELDVLAPLTITDLKHRLQLGFLVTVGLPLLSATKVKYFHISLCLSAFSTCLGQSAGGLMPLSVMSVSLCSVFWSVTMKPRPLWLQAVRKQKEAAHRHAAPLSHKVHKVTILIKRRKVSFLTIRYRSTFLVSVYRATLLWRGNRWMGVGPTMPCKSIYSPLKFSTFCHILTRNAKVFYWDFLFDRPTQSGVLLWSGRKIIHGFILFFTKKKVWCAKIFTSLSQYLEPPFAAMTAASFLE